MAVQHMQLHARSLTRGRACCRAESPAWFAMASFNAGQAAMGAKDEVAAAVLFKASGDFHDAYTAPTAQTLAVQRVCLCAVPLP